MTDFRVLLKVVTHCRGCPMFDVPYETNDGKFIWRCLESGRSTTNKDILPKRGWMFSDCPLKKVTINPQIIENSLSDDCCVFDSMDDLVDSLDKLEGEE